MQHTGIRNELKLTKKDGSPSILSIKQRIIVFQTYNVDRMSPDSAGTATAYLSGVKAQASTIGVNERVIRSNCSSQAGNEVDTIMDWAHEAGLWKRWLLWINNKYNDS